ncbi:MAG: hypothetical protein Ta2E_04620 [Mycoplasmoidaceae bacterium]|nr:MAG: hypothetical protein Ta2E_04620 [Mycoplasmoidaceae bacterium]
MASSWSAEKLDRIQDKFFQNEEHDRTIRCLLTFKGDIDERRLVAAVDKLTTDIPILNSTFQENDGKFFWNHREDNKSLIYSKWTNWGMFFQDFLSLPDAHSNPQIKVSLYNNIIAFKVNGMLMDIFSLKSIVAYFCQIYNNITNKVFFSRYSQPQPRSEKNLLASLPLPTRLFPSYKLSDEGFNKLKLAYVEDDGSNADSWLNTDGYYGSEVRKLFELANIYKVTIADIFMTAYHRAISDILKKKDTPINIGRQFDVRKESNIENYTSYNNAYVMLPYSIKIKEGEVFSTTLKTNADISNVIKDKKIVARKFAKDHTTYGITEYFQFVALGDLNKHNYNLQGNQIREVFFSTPARFLPYISVALTSIDKSEIFLSACNFCVENDLPSIKYLLDFIKYEIRNFINLEDPQFYTNWDEEYEKQFPEGDDSVVSQQPEEKQREQTETSQISKNTSVLDRNPDSKEKPTGPSLRNFMYNRNIERQQWTEEQNVLAQKYTFLTGSILENGKKNGYVKYKIKGKNAFQQRSWSDIKKFVDFKEKQ